MTRLIRRKRCPTCGTIDMTRWPRTFWMRLFKNSRHYQCRHCRTHLLLLGDGEKDEEPHKPDVWHDSDSQLTLE